MAKRKKVVTTQGNKYGGKFTDTQREQVMRIVAELDARGYSQHEIAAELEKIGMGVSQPVVGGYLKTIRQRFIDLQMSSRMDLIARKMALYEDLRRQAQESFDFTKGLVVEELKAALVDKLSEDGLEQLPEAVEITLKKSPMGEWVRIMVDIVNKECELLGLTDKVGRQLHGHVVLDPKDKDKKEERLSWDLFTTNLFGNKAEKQLPAIETTATRTDEEEPL